VLRSLVFCEHASLNGGERSLLAVADRLCELGVDLRIAVPSAGPLSEAVRRTRAVCVPWTLSSPSPHRPPDPDRNAQLKALIQEHSPSVVHANNLVTSRWLGPVARDIGVPSLGHLRDIMGVSRAAVLALNAHTRLLAVSHAVRDACLANGLESGKMVVVYNGVDLERFRPKSRTGFLARELAIPRNSTLLVTIGQIGIRKGLDVLLAAACRVVAARNDAHFLIIGARYSNKEEAVQFERELHREAAGRPLAGHVHFLGLREDVADILAEATLLVHAARQEPLGRVLLEAAATGTPVVATWVGGTQEIFPPDSAAARLVPPDDAGSLAQAMLDVLADLPLQRRMSAAGRLIAETKFDASQAAANLAEQYWAVAGGVGREGRI
jgi:glycosyltransferase involved in cell wall biosynthesis